MADLARWGAIFAELGGVGDPQVHAQLRQHYSDPQRRLHTLRRVASQLDALAAAAEHAAHPQELELAIWFRAAIFDPRSAENERRSAQWARNVARAAGLSMAVCDRIHDLVLVVAPGSEARQPDEALMLDIEHAELGEAPVTYARFESALRQSFAHLPQALYAVLRRKAIADLLARPGIYYTEYFGSRLEARARSNLEHSLHRLP